MQWEWSIDGWIVLAGTLAACSCALLGNYLVLRRLSLMGDAISHAVLPGLALAFIITQSRAAWPMFLGAVIVGGLTALLTEVITRYGKVEHGAAMGVVFSILFAVGLILIRRAADSVDLDPGCVLYGNIVQIPLDATGDAIPPAIVNLAIALVANCLFVGFFYKELKITAFDPQLATALGINAGAMHYALMVMVAITTVASFEAVGSILVIAMLIVPAVAAHLLTDRLGVMIAISLVFAAISAVGGHFVAVFGPGWVGLDATAETSAMMAVVAGAILGVAIVASPQYGVVARVWNRAALSMQIVRQDVLGLLYRWRELQPRSGRAMLYREVIDAVGGGRLARRALKRLVRTREIVGVSTDEGAAIRLTPNGLASASQLVGSHRLWETYLAKNFDLATDHLHAPAERMEHFITSEMQAELREQLAETAQDPHGKPIPQPDEV